MEDPRRGAQGDRRLAGGDDAGRDLYYGGAWELEKKARNWMRSRPQLDRPSGAGARPRRRLLPGAAPPAEPGWQRIETDADRFRVWNRALRSARAPEAHSNFQRSDTHLTECLTLCERFIKKYKILLTGAGLTVRLESYSLLPKAQPAEPAAREEQGMQPRRVWTPFGVHRGSCRRSNGRAG